MRLSHVVCCALVPGSIHMFALHAQLFSWGSFHFAADCTIARLKPQLAPKYFVFWRKKVFGQTVISHALPIALRNGDCE